MALTVSVLVPVYNNSEHLEELYVRTTTTLTRANIDFELILVNDGSRDGSWDIIRRLAGSDQRVKALCLSRNFGQHAAISAALEHASGDNIVLMDADLQDRPELIPELLEQLSGNENDIVYTLKYGGEESPFKRMTSRAFHSFVGTTTNSRTTANIGTFRAFNRGVANALLGYRERAVVYGPLMHTMGYRTSFVPVPRDPRFGSRSSYTFAKRLALAFQSIVSYSTLPQKAFLWMGGIVCAASMLYLGAVIVQYSIGTEGLAQGLTLLVVLVLLLMGMMMIGMGVLAAYMFLIFRETLDRPRYHVQESVNVSQP